MKHRDKLTCQTPTLVQDATPLPKNGGMSTSQKVKFVAVAAIASGILSGAIYSALSLWMDDRSAGVAGVTSAVALVGGLSALRANSYRGRLPKQGG